MKARAAVVAAIAVVALIVGGGWYALANTHGPSGSQGPAGVSGPVGPIGAQGQPGPSGSPGANGANGYNGSAGATGKAGATGSTGPAGPAGPQGPSGVVGVGTHDFGGIASVPTGGGFVANSTLVGSLPISVGTFEICLNAKATPNAATSGQVFPQFFVYDQPKSSAFTGDLFNVGSGALEPFGTNHDSYYSGCTVVVISPTDGPPLPLDIYAFGYDSDSGAGSYKLDDLSITGVQLNT